MGKEIVEKTYDERIAEAGKRYLSLGGYKYIDTSEGFDVFSDPYGELVFVIYTDSRTRWYEPPIKEVRDDFETAMVNFFLERGEDKDDLVDIPIRCDIVALRIIDKDRALIRHNVNALSDK